MKPSPGAVDKQRKNQSYQGQSRQQFQSVGRHVPSDRCQQAANPGGGAEHVCGDPESLSCGGGVAVRVLGLPLTRLLRPEVLGEERVVDGRFQFHVRVRLRGIGFVVEYQGTLVPVAEA